MESYLGTREEPKEAIFSPAEKRGKGVKGGGTGRIVTIVSM